MDIQKSIRMAVESGKVEFGARSGLMCALRGDAKMILVASNCPKPVREEIFNAAKKSDVSIKGVEFTSMELGSVCGKPYPISILAIMDAGNSEILKDSAPPPETA